MLQPVTAAALAELPGIAHGFFTRHGGASQGIYRSLNCGLGSGDDQASVRENRGRVAAHLTAHDLITAHQIHSPTAVIVKVPWAHAQRPRADAIATRTPGLALGVLTADCAPVLFADADARVVAAAHAGWRGALFGVLEAAIEAMQTLGARPERIRAAVGPCIGPGAYEVGPEFKDKFLAEDPASGRYFHEPAAGARPHFDLPGYVEGRLSRAGVVVAALRPRCTYVEDVEFFSFRGSQARKEQDYGRQISAIVLT